MRTRFTEFSDTSDYPDALIQDSIDIALLIMEAKTALSDSWAVKMALFLTAHYLDFNKTTADGDPTNKYPVTSLSLGPTSTGFGGGDATSEWGQFLNASSYGQQYNSLMRIWRLQNRMVVTRSG